MLLLSLNAHLRHKVLWLLMPGFESPKRFQSLPEVSFMYFSAHLVPGRSDNIRAKKSGAKQHANNVMHQASLPASVCESVDTCFGVTAPSYCCSPQSRIAAIKQTLQQLTVSCADQGEQEAWYECEKCS